MRLDPTRTLRTIIAGSTNTRAIELVRAAVRGAGVRPDPLLVRGPSGAGKTHLLQAATAELVRRTPACRVVALKGEDFANRYVEAIRGGWVYRVREPLRTCDALVVDELEHFTSRPATFEELRATIEVLVGKGRPVILATSSMTDDCVTSCVRAFASGVIVDVRLPTLQQRMQALRRVRGRERLALTRLLEIARRSPRIPEARAALENELFRLGAIGDAGA